MAGEVFIARQDTLETVKGTVDGIDSGVKQTNNALGNFSGGGTDTVKTELETMKNNMAQLQTKVDQLLNKGGGEFDFLNAEIQLSTETFSLEPNKEYAVYCSVNPGASTAPVITSDGRVTCDVKLNGKLLYHQSGARIIEPLPTNVPFKISVTSNSCFIQDTNKGDFIYIIK